MQNENVKFKFFRGFRVVILYDERKITKVDQEIYSAGKSEDSPGSFGFEKTRRINCGII